MRTGSAFLSGKGSEGLYNVSRMIAHQDFYFCSEFIIGIVL